LAIIGCALRTPGANNAQAFWQLLIDKRRVIGTVPKERWDAQRLIDYRSDVRRRDSLRWGSFLDDIGRFDTDFFHIPPAEACMMDPQQRQILEVGYLCAEHAGLTLPQLHESRSGVYVGLCSLDYNQLVCRDFRQILAGTTVGVSLFGTPNRLSWFLKLKGPSMAADAACSSSLVALHQASAALSSQEIDLAFVGGVNATLTPDVSLSFAQAGFLSQDGHCRVFDARADGYVRAEACGMVALKRLADAERDGNRILGVLRGIKLAQTGLRQGFMAPNGVAQEEVVQAAWQAAEVSGADIGYLEAHATGTLVGDAVELNALHRQLRAQGCTQRCPVGSYKPNIGYPESASGIVSLIKVLKIFEHGRIPGQCDFEELNPALAGCETLDISSAERPWPPAGKLPIVGLSTFGVGGTYAHAVLEAPPARQAKPPRPGTLWVLPLTAHCASSLHELVQHTAVALENADTAAVGEACRTAALLRTHFPYRRMAKGASAEQLKDDLKRLAPSPSPQQPPKRRTPSTPAVVLRMPNIDLVHAAQAEPARARAAALVAALNTVGITVSHIDFGELNDGDAPNTLYINCRDIDHDNPEALQRFLLHALAQLYEAGGEPLWNQLWPGPGQPSAVLPGYPFAGARHWVDPPDDAALGISDLT
jgi:acyl transferase domain-containing protein